MVFMKYRKIAAGGTFDKLHLGHKALLKKAFSLGEKVVIGLSSEKLVKKMKKEAESFEVRRKALINFLDKERVNDYKIVELDNEYGPTATDKSIEAIAVTEETLSRAFEINEIREKKNLKPLDIISIPLVLAENGMPVSTTRIKRGEIDREGRAWKKNLKKS